MTVNYEDLVTHIVDLVGGEKNVSSFMHCVTRLRFNVKDKSLVNEKKIQTFQGVLGTNWSKDQFQIIIGQNVEDVYKRIQNHRETGTDISAGEKNKKRNERKKFSVDTILDYITGSIIPLLPVLIGAGFIKLIASILVMSGIMTLETPTYVVLNFVGDAGFYFLPIFIGQNAAKKLGANQGLGMLLGAIFIHPTFIEAVTAGSPLSVFGLPIMPGSYASSVFPVLLTIAVMAPVEKFFGKYSPNMIRMILQPVLTLLVMIPIALCLLGPVGGVIGNFLSVGIIWLNDTLGFIGIALVSAIYPLLVMTGMHTALIPYSLSVFTATGTEAFLYPAAVIASVNQGVACLGVGIKSKKVSVKGVAYSSSVTAILSGVFEPALYGVNLRYKTPLYASMIGSAIGAGVAGFGHAAIYNFGGGTGLLTLPSFIGSNMSTFIWMVAGVIVGFACTLGLTLVLYKDEITEEDETSSFAAESRQSSNSSEIIQSPISASIVSLDEVKDEVFSSGAMGKGVAIIPAEDMIKSPIAGEVVSVFPTGHAIGLRSNAGAEVLIHIGMDTVELNGEGFGVLVKIGDKVNIGSPLVNVNFNLIKEKGYDITTPIVITNSNSYHTVETMQAGNVSSGENLLRLEVE